LCSARVGRRTRHPRVAAPRALPAVMKIVPLRGTDAIPVRRYRKLKHTVMKMVSLRETGRLSII
jgi:hypothetical protein